jgi:diguanylate cyclase (GGDEF)-like protein
MAARTLTADTPRAPAGSPASPGPVTKLQIGSRPARILFIDQDRAILPLRSRLEAQGARVEILDTGTEAFARARSATPDLILLDISMADVDGIGLIRELKQDPLTHKVPVMILSAMAGVDKRIQCLDEGACDYVVRPFSPEELIARIRVVLRGKSRKDVLRRRVSFLEELAASDPLTSLLNRRAFEDRLHLEMERARQAGHPLSCLILDIDWFKSVNDRYGHQVGDDTLRQVAKVILDRRRAEDVVCRYGGEEFVWLLPGLARQPLADWAEWLRRTVEEVEIPTSEGAFHVSISIGAATYTLKEHGMVSATALLEHADGCLLEAKKRGKNRVVFRDTWAPAELGGASPAMRRGDSDPGDRRAGRVILPSPTLSEAFLTDDASGEEGRVNLLRDFVESSVKVLTAALEAKDPEAMAHSQRVATPPSPSPWRWTCRRKRSSASGWPGCCTIWANSPCRRRSCRSRGRSPRTSWRSSSATPSGARSCCRKAGRSIIWWISCSTTRSPSTGAAIPTA